jgi:hypothetical protein
LRIKKGASGLLPLSGILNSKKHNILETGSDSMLHHQNPIDSKKRGIPASGCGCQLIIQVSSCVLITVGLHHL